MSPPRDAVGCIRLAMGIGGILVVGAVDIAAAPPAAATAQPAIHTVARGQTLCSIARRYGVPVSRLASANKIRNPSAIRAGARLVIPAGRPQVRGRTRGGAPRAPAPVAAPAVTRTPNQLPATDEDDELPSLPSTVSPRPGLEPPPLDRLEWPVDGPVLSGFDRPRHGHRHQGIDIGSSEGTPIHAVADGVVTLVEDHFGNYGKLVAIEHDNGLVSYYGHNSKNLVKAGQRVAADEVIALVGHSGNASCNHVHFELRVNGEPLDPAAALIPRGAEPASAVVGRH